MNKTNQEDTRIHIRKRHCGRDRIRSQIDGSMSTGVNTARRCEGCEEIGEKWEFQGDYCSTECRYRDRGESIFQQIRSDHTVCASCFGVRKVTEPPTNDWKHENGSGYQVALNSGATLSKVDGKQVLDYTEVGGTRPVAVDSVCGFEYYTPRVHKDHGLTYCQCGNVDHFGESEEIRNVNPNEVIQNLWSLLVDYYKKGQFGDHKPNQELLIEGLKESGLDYQYASGLAVYGDA